MKITDVKSYPVWVGHRNQMVVKVETDAGLYGYGEAGLSGRELAVVGAVKHYREFLIGRDSMQIGALWQEMYRSRFPVLDTPGLGVEFNEELALKQPFKFWEAPHFHKRDGSYTNW